MQDALLTCLEVARLLSIRPATVRAWTYRRLLPSVRVGTRAVRYRREDVSALYNAILGFWTNYPEAAGGWWQEWRAAHRGARLG